MQLAASYIYTKLPYRKIILPSSHSITTFFFSNLALVTMGPGGRVLPSEAPPEHGPGGCILFLLPTPPPFFTEGLWGPVWGIAVVGPWLGVGAEKEEKFAPPEARVLWGPEGRITNTIQTIPPTFRHTSSPNPLT